MHLEWSGDQCFADRLLAGKVVEYGEMRLEGRRYVPGEKYWAAFETATGERLGDRFATRQEAMAAVEDELRDQQLAIDIANLDAGTTD